jgi:hypothetical protein
MKALLAKPEFLAIVKEFLADERAEFPKTTVVDKTALPDKETGELPTKELPHGFTQKQQAILMLKMLTEVVFTDCDPQQFQQAFEIIYHTANGSAGRQAMEGAGLLAKTEGGTRGASALEMAAKWMPK